MKILPVPEIYTGESSINEIPQILNRINASKVLVITGQTIKKIGIYDKLSSILNRNNLSIIHIDDVEPDPSVKIVKNIVDKARKEKAEVIIGLGGGSSIDTAKITAGLITNDKPLDSYIGINKLEIKSIPIIAIPTTAGTGSEVTPVGVMTDTEKQQKLVVISDKIIPDFAILDPELCISAPPYLTAQCGMDALSHALEAFIANRANEYSDALALKAIELIFHNICQAYKDGSNLEARYKMLLGSLFAGMAFSNSGVGGVHALAYPLSGRFNLSHSLSISLMLPVVMEFNSVVNEEKFSQIAQALTKKPNATVKEGLEAMFQIVKEVDLNKSLVSYGITEEDINLMASDAVQISRLIQNNPRLITLEDAIEIYKKRY